MCILRDLCLSKHYRFLVCCCKCSVCLALVRRDFFFVSVKGLVCVLVCVWAVVCLPVMPLPAPDVPASQRLALDCRTLLDHRVGKGK